MEKQGFQTRGNSTFDYLKERKIENRRCNLEQPFAFISYAHEEEDAKIVKETFLNLYDSGFNLWLDLANLPNSADSWKEDAMDALGSKNCKTLIYFRSEAALVRETIKDEIKKFITSDKESGSGRTPGDIIIVDTENDSEWESAEVCLDKLEKESKQDEEKRKAYENCEAICGIVSVQCNALRYKRDDGIQGKPSKLQDKLIRKIKEHGISQNFSLQGKIEYILDDRFRIDLNPEQDRVLRRFQKMLRNCLEDGEKRVLIVSGEPGVGKSVMAMTMLQRCLRIKKKGEAGREKRKAEKGALRNPKYKIDPADLDPAVVSKNQAPRDAYKGILERRKKEAEEIGNETEAERYSKLLKDAGSCFKSAGYIGKKNIVISDESHRMTKGMAEKILDKALMSVFFVDRYQTVSLVDHGTRESIIDACRRKGVAEIKIEKLKTQMRCNGTESYLDWVDALLQTGTEPDFPDMIGKSSKYELEVFDSAKEMHDKIKELDRPDEPARIVAGYCWKWDKKKRGDSGHKDIVTGGLEISWNLRIQENGEDAPYSYVADPGSVDQAGCIHTVQGLEFSYVGVIIGPDMTLRDGRINTDYDKRAEDDYTLNKKARDEYLKKCNGEKEQKQKALEQKADEIIRNTYRTLLTRGTKGCFIYCVDPELREYMKKCVERYNESMIMKAN